VASEESASLLAIGSDLWLTAKSTPTVKESCLAEYPMESLAQPLSGTISKASDHQCSQRSLILFTGDSPARISALQEREKDWKASEAAFFSRSCALPKKSSPRSYFLKTCLLSQPGEDFALLERLPKEGMIVGGVLYPLQASEQCIRGKGGSYWLTPCTMDHLPVRTGEALENSLYRGKDRKSKRKVSGRLNEQVVYPQMWPTPRANNKMDCPSERRRDNPQLETIVNINQSTFGKKLCPRWVSVLMGYPTTHTDLEPSVMQWFLSRQKRRLKN
jgi:hypothetical protein